MLENPHIQVSSLEGLVDIAIDTNSRVINDPDRQGYFVLGDGVCYTYFPPGLSGGREDEEFEYKDQRQTMESNSERELTESVEQTDPKEKQ